MSELPNKEKLKSVFDDYESISCLDIGANTGQFANEWRKLFPNCEITSIEPNPFCENNLKKIKGVTYIQCGISNAIGELELILPKRKSRSKGASFYKELNFSNLTDDEILKIKVPVTTLDLLFPDNIFDVIKIDVQGAELDVINGGETILERATYVIMEVSLVPYNAGAPLADIVVARMADLNFFIQDIIAIHYKNNKAMQLDLLFSKIGTHRMSIVEDFKNGLGL
jgi:FkbM family methyltransferase